MKNEIKFCIAVISKQNPFVNFVEQPSSELKITTLAKYTYLWDDITDAHKYATILEKKHKKLQFKIMSV